ncbi:RAB26 protein, partial [Ciconia maguari]|nr:RAB26 protein [Ciconia maguari]
QTILVGDSGVGKTSLLVQFDQGKFIPGSFSATVGIGFTVRAQSLVPGLCNLTHPWGSSFIWVMIIYDSM